MYIWKKKAYELPLWFNTIAKHGWTVDEGKQWTVLTDEQLMNSVFWPWTVASRQWTVLFQQWIVAVSVWGCSGGEWTITTAVVDSKQQKLLLDLSFFWLLNSGCSGEVGSNRNRWMTSKQWTVTGGWWTVTTVSSSSSSGSGVGLVLVAVLCMVMKVVNNSVGWTVKYDS